MSAGVVVGVRRVTVRSEKRMGEGGRREGGGNREGGGEEGGERERKETEEKKGGGGGAKEGRVKISIPERPCGTS